MTLEQMRFLLQWNLRMRNKVKPQVQNNAIWWWTLAAYWSKHIFSSAHHDHHRYYSAREHKKGNSFMLSSNMPLNCYTQPRSWDEAKTTTPRPHQDLDRATTGSCFWTTVHCNEETRSMATQTVQHGRNGGWSEKRLSNRWLLMILCLYWNKKRL